MSNENPFGEFEDDFKSADKAPPGSAPGRVPPGTYKFVLSTNDPDEGKTPVDYDTFVGKSSGTKGFKLFAEIIEPETMPNPKTGEAEETKGKIVEHVFWITKNNLPYVKRDIATIIGRDLVSMAELTKLTWAGRTFEGVVRDEEYQGLVRSRIAFINPWQPEQPAADAKGQSAAAGKATGGADKGAKKKEVAF